MPLMPANPVTSGESAPVCRSSVSSSVVWDELPTVSSAANASPAPNGPVSAYTVSALLSTMYSVPPLRSAQRTSSMPAAVPP